MKTFRVWIKQVNAQMIDVEANTKEVAIMKAIEIWGNEIRPEVEEVEVQPKKKKIKDCDKIGSW